MHTCSVFDPTTSNSITSFLIIYLSESNSPQLSIWNNIRYLLLRVCFIVKQFCTMLISKIKKNVFTSIDISLGIRKKTQNERMPKTLILELEHYQYYILPVQFILTNSLCPLNSQDKKKPQWNTSLHCYHL